MLHNVIRDVHKRSRQHPSMLHNTLQSTKSTLQSTKPPNHTPPPVATSDDTKEADPSETEAMQILNTLKKKVSFAAEPKIEQIEQVLDSPRNVAKVDDIKYKRSQSLEKLQNRAMQSTLVSSAPIQAQPSTTPIQAQPAIPTLQIAKKKPIIGVKKISTTSINTSSKPKIIGKPATVK